MTRKIWFLEAQPQIPVKDKSIWRKSNLNLPNAADESEQDLRKFRRQRSRSNMEQINTSNLMSIKEEEKRKGLISALSQVPVQDRLTLYLRKPTDERSFLRSGSLRAPKKNEPHSNTGSTPSSPIMSRSQLLRKYRYGSNAGEDINEDITLPPSVPRRLQKTKDEDVISDKIEIDSDNIETPPVTRRKFGKMREFSSSLEDEPRRLGPVENSSQDLESPPEEADRVSPEGRSDKEMNERGSLLRNSQRLREIARRNDDEEVLGDGQFDRFSSTRRTRRYKKSQDSGPENMEKEVEEISSFELTSETQTVRQGNHQNHSEPVSKVDDKEARLKKWQNRLKYHGTAVQNEDTRAAQEAITDINKVGSELQNIEQVTANASAENSLKAKTNRKERSQSLIEPGHVTNAKKITSSKAEPKPTANQIDQVYLNQDKSEFIPEIRVQANTPGNLKGKSEHEMNDEGFEETQSLGSETPSQGTSSGCNYEQDSVDSPRLTRIGERTQSGKLNRADSSGSGDTNTSSSTNPPLKRFVRNTTGTRSLMTPSRVETLMQRWHKSDPRSNRLDRSSSVRVNQKQAEEKRSLLAGSTSIRKTDSQTSLNGNKTNALVKRRGVERSNSRTSLRSSRSSLNSSTSVNTVRNVGSRSSNQNLATDKSTSRRLVGYTTAIKNLTDNLKKESEKSTEYKRSSASEGKKPLGQVQLRNSIEKIKTSVPASRSSSSGSSIGPTIRRPKSSTLSTSFKENSVKGAKPQTVAGSRSSSNGSIISSSDVKLKSTKPSSNAKQKENSGLKAPRAGLNFMKPTAASSAKEPEMVINKLRPMTKTLVK